MNKGEIASMGTYEELKNDARFQKIIKHNTNVSNENKDESKLEKDESSDSNEDTDTKNYLSKEGHKTIEQKEDEVSLRTYWNYASYCRLSLVFLFIGTFMCVVERPGTIYQNYLVLEWVKQFSLTNDLDYQQVLKILGISMVLMIWSFSKHFTYVGQAYTIDSKLFKSMIMNITRAPINLYFDKTTSGKVLKKFNTDLE